MATTILMSTLGDKETLPTRGGSNLAPARLPKLRLPSKKAAIKILPNQQHEKVPQNQGDNLHTLKGKSPLPLKIGNPPKSNVSIKIQTKENITGGRGERTGTRPRMMTLRIKPSASSSASASKPQLRIKIKPNGKGHGVGNGDESHKKTVSIMATNPHLNPNPNPHPNLNPKGENGTKTGLGDRVGDKGGVRSFSLNLNPRHKIANHHYSYGEKRYAPPDTEPVELSPLPIGRTWFLYCETNQCLYDLETQDKIGKVEENKTIMWYDTPEDEETEP